MSRPGYIKMPNDIGGDARFVEIAEDVVLAAHGVYILTIGYCDRQRTDGAVPRRAMARAIAPGLDYARPLAELVRVGLLEETSDGWRVVGYLEWQRSREQIEGAAESARHAARSRWGNSSRNTEGNAERSQEGHMERNAPSQPAIGDIQPSREEPLSAADAADESDPSVIVVNDEGGDDVAVDGEIVATSTQLPGDAEFQLFWSAYPRHEAKKQARSAWRRLGKRDRELAVGVARVMAEAVRRGHQEARFVPMAATYLNGKRWEDWREGIPPGWQPGGADREVAAEERRRRAVARAFAEEAAP